MNKKKQILNKPSRGTNITKMKTYWSGFRRNPDHYAIHAHMQSRDSGLDFAETISVKTLGI
jgi:hypothetical protein